METAARKRNGIHYTPRPLARFLARQTVRFLEAPLGEYSVLDPACGNGQLLASIVERLPRSAHKRVFGFDTDAVAVERTRQRLRACDVEVQQTDFLQQAPNRQYDIVIANPPYVRTQVLGGKRAQRIAAEFGLSGRVDLYQAFVAQICRALKSGGVLGLLTSNRFLTVKSGFAMRRLLSSHFDLKAIFDLGDTRLFDAAVLPAVLIAVKKPSSQAVVCEFTRTYFDSAGSSDSDRRSLKSTAEGAESMFESILEGKSGCVDTCDGRVRIERGYLPPDDGGNTWSLATRESQSWLAKTRSRQACCFGDLAEIKVGIKTTADSVFVRSDWSTVPLERRPESSLIRPLITHHDATRWSIESATAKSVLYPYDLEKAKRTTVGPESYPKAFRYLESFREQLSSRTYVRDSKRSWFEIWVPQKPIDWALPKVVWPDISEAPRFFLDESGAIVNGDCYWLKLREGVDSDWLYLMLAVANSQVATTFYDTLFHNKLYGGRRRFMTQYVREFPLPELASSVGRTLVGLVKKQMDTPCDTVERQIERLVSDSFQ